MIKIKTLLQKNQWIENPLSLMQYPDTAETQSK